MSRARVMLDTLTVAHFADHVGGRFRIRFAETEVLEAELVDATAFGSKNARGPSGRQPFSLELRGPRLPVLPQGTYLIENDLIGAYELFMVPIGPDDVGMRYQIIFN